jgi:hypothetical protein
VGGELGGQGSEHENGMISDCFRGGANLYNWNPGFLHFHQLADIASTLKKREQMREHIFAINHPHNYDERIHISAW